MTVRSLRLGHLYDATFTVPAENVTLTIEGDRFGTVTTRSKDLGEQDLDLGSYFALMPISVPSNRESSQISSSWMATHSTIRPYCPILRTSSS